MHSNVDVNSLDWQFTPTTDYAAPSIDFKKSFKPRVKPFLLVNAVSSDIIEIPPTEYLIGQSNGLMAIGVAKNRNHSQPLTMQFGNWKSMMEAKKLYVGCTVVVKSYAVVLEKFQSILRNVIPSNYPTKDMICKGRLDAAAQAVEWAILSKPLLQPHLGYVTEFRTSKYKLEGDYFFLATIYDQESYAYFSISNEQFPYYIKKPLQIQDPVVINWVKIEEPHRVLQGSVGFKTMLPDREDLPMFTTRISGETTFWIDSIDTRLGSINSN